MSDSEDILDHDHASTVEPILGIGEEITAGRTSVIFAGNDKKTEVSLEVANVSPDGTPIFNPRAYQLEMFRESMKHNIIVVVSHFITCSTTNSNCY